MSNLVILDNVEHHDLKVSCERGEAFGDHTNQVLVFPNEFRELQREYPIFFRKDEQGEYQSVALLGLDRDENLFLNGNEWNARYIPAVQARGPFSIGLRQGASGDEHAEPMIRIDLDCAAVSKTEGVPLFLPQGGYSPYLDNVLKVLRTLYAGVEDSKAFFTILQDMELIEPVTVEIKLSETQQYTVPDVFSISEERFNKLATEQIEKLHQTGFLASCYWALSSLDNVNLLVELKTMKVGG